MRLPAPETLWEGAELSCCRWFRCVLLLCKGGERWSARAARPGKAGKAGELEPGLSRGRFHPLPTPGICLHLSPHYRRTRGFIFIFSLHVKVNEDNNIFHKSPAFLKIYPQGSGRSQANWPRAVRHSVRPHRAPSAHTACPRPSATAPL